MAGDGLMKQSGQSFLKRRMWQNWSDPKFGAQISRKAAEGWSPYYWTGSLINMAAFSLSPIIWKQISLCSSPVWGENCFYKNRGRIFWLYVLSWNWTVKLAVKYPVDKRVRLRLGGRPSFSATLLLDFFKCVLRWSFRLSGPSGMGLKAGTTRRRLNLWHCQWKWPIKDLWSVRLEPCVVINLCLPIWPGGGRRGGRLVLCGVFGFAGIKISSSTWLNLIKLFSVWDELRLGCFMLCTRTPVWISEVSSPLCWALTPWTSAFRTRTRCLTQGWEATPYKAGGSIACIQVRGPGTDNTSLSHCTIHPAWSRLGPPASTSRARMPGALRPLSRSSAAATSLWATSTTSLSTSLRSKPTFHTCSGCKGPTGKVRPPRGSVVGPAAPSLSRCREDGTIDHVLASTAIRESWVFL